MNINSENLMVMFAMIEQRHHIYCSNSRTFQTLNDSRCYFVFHFKLSATNFIFQRYRIICQLRDKLSHTGVFSNKTKIVGKMCGQFESRGNGCQHELFKSNSELEHLSTGSVKYIIKCPRRHALLCRHFLSQLFLLYLY